MILAAVILTCHAESINKTVGTGAAIGAEMLVANDVKQSGLFVPEMLPIERYLHRMRGKGLGVHQEILAM